MSKINQIHFVDLPTVTVLSGRLFNYVAAENQHQEKFNSHANIVYLTLMQANIY